MCLLDLISYDMATVEHTGVRLRILQLLKMQLARDATLPLDGPGPSELSQAPEPEVVGLSEYRAFRPQLDPTLRNDGSGVLS